MNTEFWIQASCPRWQGIIDPDATTVDEACESVFPLDTEGAIVNLESKQRKMKMHPDPLTDEDLLRIQQLCNAATPGPWTAFIEDRDHESGSSFIQTAGMDIELSGASEADYDFIASARQDVPRLLAEVYRLRKV